MHDDLLSFGKSLEMHIANLEKANSLILVKAINAQLLKNQGSYVNMLGLTQEQDPTLCNESINCFPCGANSISTPLTCS